MLNSAMMGGGGTMMGEGMMGAMGAWGFLLLATLLVVLVATVVAGVWLVRRILRDRDDEPDGSHDAVGPGSGADPLDTLRQRYAAGEIEEDEYQRRRSMLSGR